MIVENQTYRDATIILDGNAFTNCQFTNCVLQYYGLGSVKLNSNQITDCRWQFGGPALETLQFMSALYGGGASRVIEATFASIRGGPAKHEGLMQ